MTFKVKVEEELEAEDYQREREDGGRETETEAEAEEGMLVGRRMRMTLSLRTGLGEAIGVIVKMIMTLAKALFKKVSTNSPLP